MSRFNQFDIENSDNPGPIAQDNAEETRIWVPYPRTNEGRLTLTSGTPVTTSDVTGASTIYFTPYIGNRITIFNTLTLRWELHDFEEVSLALSGVSVDTNYDVFLFLQSDVLTLESVAWTDGTNRATALTDQDGVKVKSGAKERRYLGTIRGTGTNTTEDSQARRLVWNYQNRVTRQLHAHDATDSWTWSTTATWREANGSTTLGDTRVEVVIGQDEDLVNLMALAVANPSTTGARPMTGIGLDSTTALAADAINQMAGGVTGDLPLSCLYAGHVGLGYHWLQWIERTETAASDFYGDNGSAGNLRTGLIGNVKG